MTSMHRLIPYALALAAFGSCKREADPPREPPLAPEQARPARPPTRASISATAAQRSYDRDHLKQAGILLTKTRTLLAGFPVDFGKLCAGRTSPPGQDRIDLFQKVWRHHGTRLQKELLTYDPIGKSAFSPHLYALIREISRFLPLTASCETPGTHLLPMKKIEGDLSTVASYLDTLKAPKAP